MNILTVEGLTKSYGEKVIFDNISFGIDSKDKIGIIGVNGTGKSTLLKIIAGEDTADSGTVTTMNGIKIGYLPQTPVFNEAEAVIDYMDRICNLSDDKKLSEAKSVLTRLGIDDYYKLISELSGGQRKRVALAAAMIAPVDLLILDEPTNHIDNETVDWIENNMKSATKALLMVTHDRYFLDRMVNKTIELDKGRLYTYEGNYSEFLVKKAEREELEQAGERKRQSFLRTELEWIRRGARARTTKQKARIERFEEISDIKAPTQTQSIEINGVASRLGKKTIEAVGISKAYNNVAYVKNFSYIVLKDDRIGIVGKNGAGKSTLLNMLSCRLSPDNGSVVIGETVKIGFFSQENNEMPQDKRVIDYVKDFGEYIETSKGKLSASQLLEKFVFTPDMQYSPISKLSGGEKRRLYLLTVLMSAPNILFLDEPTNDLDIQTLCILEDYLDGFNGPVVIVSHDRYFLDRCVNRIFSFEGNGYIKQYEGNYSDYIATKNINAVSVKSEATVKEKKIWDKGEKKLKMSYNEQREMETIDDEIAELESSLEKIDVKIQEASASYSLLQELLAEKEELEQKLSYKMDRWVYLTELAEKIGMQ